MERGVVDMAHGGGESINTPAGPGLRNQRRLEPPVLGPLHGGGASGTLPANGVSAGETGETNAPPTQDVSWAPRTKLATAAGVGGPFSVVLQWAATQAGLVMPPEVSIALAALIIFCVGYLTPEK